MTKRPALAFFPCITASTTWLACSSCRPVGRSQPPCHCHPRLQHQAAATGRAHPHLHTPTPSHNDSQSTCESQEQQKHARTWWAQELSLHVRCRQLPQRL
jgi:hypothetical protein